MGQTKITTFFRRIPFRRSPTPTTIPPKALSLRQSSITTYFLRAPARREASQSDSEIDELSEVDELHENSSVEVDKVPEDAPAMTEDERRPHRYSYALGDIPQECSWCKKSLSTAGALYVCAMGDKCLQGMYACSFCTLIAHEQRPEHRFVSRWSVDAPRWKKVSLADLGYVYQEGHNSVLGECGNPAPTTRFEWRSSRWGRFELEDDHGRSTRSRTFTTANSYALLLLSETSISTYRRMGHARSPTFSLLPPPRKRPRIENDALLNDWLPMDSTNIDGIAALAAGISAYEQEPDEEDMAARGDATGSKRRYASSDDPMGVWLPHASTFLDELVRRDGLGDSTRAQTCLRCSVDTSKARTFQCLDCGGYLQCESCIRAGHKTQPLHRIQEWNGDYWVRVSLYSPRAPDVGLGLVFQLGHYGLRCPNPAKEQRMVVIDVHGVFTIRLQACNCSLGQRRNIIRQLIAYGWYPATTTDPETCVTLQALELFRLLQVVGNLNAHDFIGTLERLNDPARVDATPDRYKAFFRMTQQHSYLMRAKRCGRAHVVNGLADTRAGQLVVDCWACPQDGRNLPEGWRLVRREDHRPLGPPGYFVVNETYKRHLLNYVEEKEISSCAAFAAITQRDTRNVAGLRVSGVGGVVCARHGLVRRHGLGDLQKGERYANMDFIVLATLVGETVTHVTISYDIACHWERLLPVRASRIVENTGLPIDLDDFEIQYAIPVWHAAAHEISCRSRNTLSYAIGVGKTDGEGIERTCIGRILMRKLIVAIAELDAQEKEYAELTESVPRDLLPGWEKMLSDWLEDRTKPNPYIIAGGKEGPSEREVTEELKAAEVEDARAGRATLLEGGKVTAAAFVKAGLQLEDIQRRIRAELQSNQVLTASRSSAIQEQRFNCLKKLKAFQELQLTYMPGVDDLRQRDEALRDVDAPGPKAEDIPLYLPSQLLPEERRICARGVVKAEKSLRLGQLSDALMALRASLHSQAHIICWRNSNAVGQRSCTRSATLLERVGERITRTARKYRDGYDAMVAFEGTEFSPTFLKLEDKDISARPGLESDTSALIRLRAAESNRASRNEPTGAALRAYISWIWGVQGGSDRNLLHDSVRVEWTKARTRRDRWAEEVVLLREEMKRVLRTLSAVQREWTSRASAREEPDVALASGLHAYALKQRDLHHRIADTFYTGWSQSAIGAASEMWESDGLLLQQLASGESVAEVLAMAELTTVEDSPAPASSSQSDPEPRPNNASFCTFPVVDIKFNSDANANVRKYWSDGPEGLMAVVSALSMRSIHGNPPFSVATAFTLATLSSIEAFSFGLSPRSSASLWISRKPTSGLPLCRTRRATCAFSLNPHQRPLLSSLSSRSLSIQMADTIAHPMQTRSSKKRAPLNKGSVPSSVAPAKSTSMQTIDRTDRINLRPKLHGKSQVEMDELRQSQKRDRLRRASQESSIGLRRARGQGPATQLEEEQQAAAQGAAVAPVAQQLGLVAQQVVAVGPVANQGAAAVQPAVQRRARREPRCRGCWRRPAARPKARPSRTKVPRVLASSSSPPKARPSRTKARPSRTKVPRVVASSSSPPKARPSRTKVPPRALQALQALRRRPQGAQQGAGIAQQRTPKNDPVASLRHHSRRIAAEQVKELAGALFRGTQPGIPRVEPNPALERLHELYARLADLSTTITTEVIPRDELTKLIASAEDIVTHITILEDQIVARSERMIMFFRDVVKYSCQLANRNIGADEQPILPPIPYIPFDPEQDNIVYPLLEQQGPTIIDLDGDATDNCDEMKDESEDELLDEDELDDEDEDDADAMEVDDE
ncbi:CxC2 domain-containing protein [Mycena kentingensis (nom. inval.)]|nr:CxC2 domain-containing protein [Mycena kentingensis (nom. inval.)]